MKALSTAILEGVSTFVMAVFVMCIMMAILSYISEIDEKTYTWLGWYLPVAMGVGKGIRKFAEECGWIKTDSQG